MTQENQQTEGFSEASVFHINLYAGLASMAVGLFTLYGALYHTVHKSPGKYGASARDLPLFCSLLILTGAVLLIAITLLSRADFRARYERIGTTGELVRLLRYAATLLIIPIFLRTVGFYVTLCAVLITLHLESGMRRPLYLGISTLTLIMFIYVLLQLISRRMLPSGILI